MIVKVISVALLMTVFSLGVATARAATLKKDYQYTELPQNWQPAISFFTPGLPTKDLPCEYCQGVFFFEMEKNQNTGVSRILKVRVLYDREDAKTKKKWYQQDQVFEMKDLIPSKKNPHGYVVRMNSGRRVIALFAAAHELQDQQQTVHMTVLKEANVIDDDYATKPLTLYFYINEAGVVVASLAPRDAGGASRAFNIMAQTPRMKSFPFKGKIPAGITKIEFYRDAVDAAHKLKNSDYIPE